jgi:hypothetical protein
MLSRYDLEANDNNIVSFHPGNDIARYERIYTS